MARKTKFETTAQYFDSLSDHESQVLQMMRTRLLEAAPGAIELIHYQIPALAYEGEVFIYFAAFKNHVHVTLPHPRSVFNAFAAEFAALDISKSTIRLPKNEPIPLDLLSRAVAFRVNELSHR